MVSGVVNDVECPDMYTGLLAGKYFIDHLLFAIDDHGQLLQFFCSLVLLKGRWKRETMGVKKEPNVR
jgi:hypothetical protein